MAPKNVEEMLARTRELEQASVYAKSLKTVRAAGAWDLPLSVTACAKHVGLMLALRLSFNYAILGCSPYGAFIHAISLRQPCMPRITEGVGDLGTWHSQSYRLTY